MVDEVICQVGLDPGMTPKEACDRAREELGIRSVTGISTPSLHLHELLVRPALETGVALACAFCDAALNDNLCEIMEYLGLPTELKQ